MSLLLLLNNQDDDATPAAADLELLYKPVRDDVARILRNRLFAQGGRIPRFLNEDDANGPTDPTRDEVDKLIDDAASDVAGTVGINLPETIHPIARRVVALGTALLVEIGSEDFDQDRYDRIERLYDKRLPELLEAAQDINTGGEAGDADDRMLAAGSFTGHGSDVPGSEHTWDTIGKTGIGNFEC